MNTFHKKEKGNAESESFRIFLVIKDLTSGGKEIPK
jgi:hypothetical protein